MPNEARKTLQKPDDNYGGCEGYDAAGRCPWLDDLYLARPARPFCTSTHAAGDSVYLNRRTKAASGS